MVLRSVDNKLDENVTIEQLMQSFAITDRDEIVLLACLCDDNLKDCFILQYSTYLNLFKFFLECGISWYQYGHNLSVLISNAKSQNRYDVIDEIMQQLYVLPGYFAHHHQQIIAECSMFLMDRDVQYIFRLEKNLIIEALYQYCNVDSLPVHMSRFYKNSPSIREYYHERFGAFDAKSVEYVIKFDICIYQG